MGRRVSLHLYLHLLLPPLRCQALSPSCRYSALIPPLRFPAMMPPLRCPALSSSPRCLALIPPLYWEWVESVGGLYIIRVRPSLGTRGLWSLFLLPDKFSSLCVTTMMSGLERPEVMGSKYERTPSHALCYTRHYTSSSFCPGTLSQLLTVQGASSIWPLNT